MTKPLGLRSHSFSAISGIRSMINRYLVPRLGTISEKLIWGKICKVARDLRRLCTSGLSLKTSRHNLTPTGRGEVRVEKSVRRTKFLNKISSQVLRSANWVKPPGRSGIYAGELFTSAFPQNQVPSLSFPSMLKAYRQNPIQIRIHCDPKKGLISIRNSQSL